MTPVSVTSTYTTNGRLSVQEFVQAGDFLTNNWPLWSWRSLSDSSSLGSSAFAYLPYDKQYIRASRIVSLLRVSEVYNESLREEEEVMDNSIVISMEKPKSPDSIKQRDIEIFESCENEEVVLDDCGLLEDGTDDRDFKLNCYSLPMDSISSPLSGIRLYNLDITYDTYYSTPRIWIFGFDIYGNALTYMEIMEDISSEHKHRTVTVEAHPITKYACISIHPCMHSNLMLQFGPKKGHCDPAEAILHLLPLLTTIMPTTDFVGLGC